jgi:hypothetical protein
MAAVGRDDPVEPGNRGAVLPCLAVTRSNVQYTSAVVVEWRIGGCGASSQGVHTLGG